MSPTPPQSPPWPNTSRRLNRVQAEDHTTILRLLIERRDDLVAERTRSVNRLHVLLRDLHAGGADAGLSTAAAAALLRTIRPLTTVDAQRKSIARELLADVRRLDREHPQFGPGRAEGGDC